MPAVHPVAGGEWVSRIADVYGITDWKNEIWRLPDNDDLRARRDPYVLGPGDQLALPVAECRQDPSGTAAQHPFEIKLLNDVLRFRILMLKPAKDGKPDEYVATNATKIEYRMHREGTHPVGTGSVPISGGMAEIVLVRDATKVEIRYDETSDDAHVLKRRVMCRLGCLRPLSMKDEGAEGVELRARGTQQRLLALGFAPGPLNGTVGPRTRGAVRSFQQIASQEPLKGQLGIKATLPISGRIDEPTITALREAYGA